MQSALQCVGGSCKSMISRETIGQKCSVSEDSLVIYIVKMSHGKKSTFYFYLSYYLKFPQAEDF